MIKVGDYVHYANTGLCRVEEITAPGFTAADKGRLYYRLTPAETPGSTIYTPVDNRKVEMRLAMTRQEALALIDSTELALALGREKEEMDEVIRSRIGEKEPGRDGTGRD